MSGRDYSIDFNMLHGQMHTNSVIISFGSKRMVAPVQLIEDQPAFDLWFNKRMIGEN